MNQISANCTSYESPENQYKTMLQIEHSKQRTTQILKKTSSKIHLE